jgi:membrane protein DedA with SNARE-associated domain
MVVLWFIKGLTIGATPLESFITVLFILVVLAVGGIGLYAVGRWLTRELGDHNER